MKKDFTDHGLSIGQTLCTLMKITAAQLAVALAVCSVAVAHTNYGQELLDREVSLSFKNVSLKNALAEIETLAQVRFQYSDDMVRLSETINLTVERKRLGDVLTEILTPVNIRFAVRTQHDFIILMPIPPARNDHGYAEPLKQPETGMLYAVATITGKITDASTKEPLPGVSVVVKGTTNGVMSDAEGNYSLTANESDVLVFSFIGYTTVEFSVNGRTVIDVALQADTKTLQTVVINAGYWQVTDHERTGNISRVTAEEISKQPVNSPLQALVGRMPGVVIQQNSGVPGGSFTIHIRGRNSIRPNADNPLYIVDGVPFTSAPLGSMYSGLITGGGNPLNNINPANIESIEVLKDADATAIYGSRGANGVVLITTKKGKAGTPEVNINIYQGVGKVSSKMDLLNTQQYLEMRREAFENDEAAFGSTRPDYDLLLWDTTRYTDWQKELLGGTANTTSAQVSVSGGSDNTKFLFGIGYYRETTVFPGDFDDQKTSAHFNINHNSLDRKFQITFSGSFLVDDNNLLYRDLTSSAVLLPPVAPTLYDEDGNLNWEDGSWDNPLAFLKQKYKARTTNLMGNSVVSYTIVKGLQLKANLGYTQVRLDETTTNPLSSFNPNLGAVSGTSSFTTNNIVTWIAEPQLNYDVAIGKGNLNILTGTTFQQNTGENKVLNATGFSNDALLENLRSATTITINADNYSLYRYNAVFGRINYQYDNKYFINLTARRDGSSRFGSGRQFANFGAVGVAWIFSNENFMQQLSGIVSYGKLRGSIGTTGNDQIGDYAYLDLWRSTTYAYAGTQGLYPENLYNPDYAWEGNKRIEAAIDLGFIKDRILLSTSLYRNRSSNQLLGFNLPATTGFASIVGNFPATVQNSGVEIELRTENVSASNFKWTTSLNYSLPRNKLVSLKDFEGSAWETVYDISKPITIKKGLHYTGVDPQTGLNTFQDVNDNGSGMDITADYLAMKNNAVKFYGGLNNSFTFSNFQVDVFFQYVKQDGSNYLTGFSEAPGAMTNQPAIVMNRWQNPGDETNIQRFTQNFGAAYNAYRYNYLYGDGTISDASFIRLKTLSVSYQLPAKFLNRVMVKGCRVYVSAQNLLTITNYLGLDPENRSILSLPPLRVFAGGLQISL